MRRTKCFAAALLICLTLCGCAQPENFPQSENEPEIAYIPLDDRPDNYERVIYLADSLGYELIMPEEDLYATRLDSQPTNSNGTQYGDRAALYEWLLEQEERGCDRYIIFTDQLLSGGLVNSRAMSESEPVTLSDGSVMSEEELLQSLIEILGADKNNRVWLLDSVMRLAPTVGYQGGDYEGYEALRSYAEQPRPILEKLSLDAVCDSYRMSADGGEVDAEAFDLSPETIDTYLAARSRKMLLSDEMLRLLEDRDIFRVLIGIDDSSSEYCIQKNEIEYLRSLLREGDALLSGVDDLAFKALARLYLDECGWDGADIEISYFGGTENEPACIYDYRALNELVSEHLEFFGLTEKKSAELSLVVLTQPEEQDASREYWSELLLKLKDNARRGKMSILIDASDSRYGLEFQQFIIDRFDLGELLAYSGALDMAIVTGTAISHGVSRYAYLLNNGGDTQQSREAWCKTLADSIIKDFCYRNVARAQVAEYIDVELGGNHDNMYSPEVDRDAVREYMSRLMDELAKPVIENLSGSRLASSAEPFKYSPWGDIELSGYDFPWARSFEITMRIDITQ